MKKTLLALTVLCALKGWAMNRETIEILRRDAQGEPLEFFKRENGNECRISILQARPRNGTIADAVLERIYGHFSSVHTAAKNCKLGYNNGNLLRGIAYAQSVRREAEETEAESFVAGCIFDLGFMEGVKKDFPEANAPVEQSLALRESMKLWDSTQGEDFYAYCSQKSSGEEVVEHSARLGARFRLETHP